MAATGPSVTLPQTLPFTLGQGSYSAVRALLSFDDVSVATPTWVDKTAKLRSYDVEHGRTTELDDFEPGKATAVFDDNDRSLDPTVTASVRPRNRLWLYEEFSGEVHDLFKGFAESWQHSYDPSGKFDAVATVVASDALKRLSTGALPTTSPVRGSYEDLVASDNPSGYWRLNEAPELRVQPAEPTEPNPEPWHPGLFKTPKHGKGWT